MWWWVKGVDFIVFFMVYRRAKIRDRVCKHYCTLLSAFKKANKSSRIDSKIILLNNLAN